MTAPALFLSHGSPALAIEKSPSTTFLKTVGRDLPRPAAIIIATAHWNTRDPALSSAAQPETIHDFHGFPEELYAMRYPAPGDPALAVKAAGLLARAGFAAGVDDRRGFDHGTWSPLWLAYPDADIPVVQLSVQPHRDARHHFDLGRALAPLRDEGVMIAGSGAATHDLRRWRGQAIDSPAASDSRAFHDWLIGAVEAGDTGALLDWTRHPHALSNHPTPEHFLPLFVPLGAAAGQGARTLHRDFTYGVLSMAAFAWG